MELTTDVTINVTNIVDLFGFIPYMDENERTFMLRLPTRERIVLTLVLSLSLIWGTLMKVFVYFNVMNEKFSERPFNVLIIVDQVLLHIFHMAMSLTSLLNVRAEFNLILEKVQKAKLNYNVKTLSQHLYLL